MQFFRFQAPSSSLRSGYTKVCTFRTHSQTQVFILTLPPSRYQNTDSFNFRINPFNKNQIVAYLVPLSKVVTLNIHFQKHPRLSTPLPKINVFAKCYDFSCIRSQNQNIRNLFFSSLLVLIFKNPALSHPYPPTFAQVQNFKILISNGLGVDKHLVIQSRI